MFTALSNKIYVYWLNLFSSYTLKEEIEIAIQKSVRDLLVAKLQLVKAQQDVKLKHAMLAQLVKQLNTLE